MYRTDYIRMVQFRNRQVPSDRRSCRRRHDAKTTCRNITKFYVHITCRLVQ